MRGGGGHARWRRGMIVAEVALSLVCCSSGGCVRTASSDLLEADPGFRPENVFTVRVRTPPSASLQDPTSSHSRTAIATRSQLPGGSACGAGTAALTSRRRRRLPTTIKIPGAPGNTGNADRDAVLTDVIGARAGYFEVMGMRLTAGRTFEPSTDPAVDEAVVDAVFARHFPGANPVGAKMPFGQMVPVHHRRRRSTGETQDLHQDGRPQVYFRISTRQFQRALFYVLAADRDPKTLLPDFAIGGAQGRLSWRLATRARCRISSPMR